MFIRQLFPRTCVNQPPRSQCCESVGWVAQLEEEGNKALSALYLVVPLEGVGGVRGLFTRIYQYFQNIPWKFLCVRNVVK